MKKQDTISHNDFLKGFNEHKRPVAKYAFIVPLVVFAAQWAYSTTDHFGSLHDYYKYTIFGISILTFFIAIFVMATSRKCPLCKDRMKKLDPAPDDYVTTYKYYCENCKLWVDRGKTNGTD